MAFNLIDTVKGFITPDVVDRASAQLGESRDGVNKAITGSIPALFASFINRAESGDAHGLLSDARQAASHNLTESSATLFTGSSTGQPAGWGSQLFGGKFGAIVSAIASYAGIKADSANSLLSLLAPLSMGVLGRHVVDNNLDAGGLRSFLTSQKSSIMSALPAGLNIGNLLSGGTRSAETTVQGNVRSAERATVADEPRRSNWLWPLLIGLAALALIIYFFNRGCNKEAETTTTSDTTTTTYTAPVATDTTTAAGTRQATKVRLANNTELNAYQGGVEERLVNCLNDANCKAGRDQWFDFDNINFETGSSRLTSESQTQINNIVAILKAYPKAKVKIGGYTDKVGNEAANKKLSQDRAAAVTNAIKAGGITDAQLLAPEGYGSSMAKLPATASDEERRADRRISVQLREKG